MSPLLLPLFAPLLLAGVSPFALISRPVRPRRLLLLIEAAALAALGVAAAALLLLAGPGEAGASAPLLIARGGLGLSVRIDALSLAMLLLVSFVGWVVVRYAARYLDGEPRQARFMAWLCLTLAAVMVMVVAGNLLQLVLAWVATSLALHRLLLFYPDRPGARRAARKKFITARAGDAALVAACLCLGAAYRTADIGAVLAAARAGAGGSAAVLAAALLAVAAMLKTAQFPTHGWLTEVMEAPTPVSALLHAGVINAGGFLLIRFADVMLLSPVVLAALVVIGGFTALFGALVMLTQPAVKTSLAWSTVAQMGFMILECGLSLFPLALLHLLAHSLYKAHAFLAAGGAVGAIAADRRPGPVAVPTPAAVLRAFLAALAIHALAGTAFGMAHEAPQAIALGTILIFGVAYLLAQGLADAAPRPLTRRIAVQALAASASYFALQRVALWWAGGLLPAPPPAGPLEWTLIALAVASFGLVAVLQSLFPLWAHHPAAAGLRVHLANGLYANALFDRALGAWSLRNSR